MRRVFIAIAAFTLASAPQSPGGEIAGRIIDTGGGGISGARVTARLADENREAITDAAGRFELRALSLGRWAVAVELAGFRTREGTLPLSATTPRARVEWTLEVGCIAEAQRVVFSPREAARHVQAIVHVRAETDNGSVIWSDDHWCGDVRREFTARLVAVSPERSGGLEAGSPVRLIGELSVPALVSGREYVILLRRANPHSEAWAFGDRQVLPVVEGVIRATREPELDGLPVADALALLGRWSRAAGRID